MSEAGSIGDIAPTPSEVLLLSHKDDSATTKEGLSPAWFEILDDETLKKEFQAIPDRMGFRIGEVSELLGVESYVLRFWETEFEQLRPKKAGNSQRMYTRKDVETAFVIRKLLHRDRFSIEGARSLLKQTLNKTRVEVKEIQHKEELQLRKDGARRLTQSLLVQIKRARSELLFAN